MKTENSFYHVPVMLNESLDGLNINPKGIFVDVTFGGGGHSREILKRLDQSGRLYGFDQDADAVENIPDDERLVFVRSNFRYLYNFMRYYDAAGQVNGILADLGVSWHHLDDATRGFSFRFDSALDMRMNQQASLTAADVLNGYSEEEISNIFTQYGELRNARRLASAILKARAEKPIATVGDLLEIVKPFEGFDKEKKFLAQVFQALRIEVNDEMSALRDMLRQTMQVLAPGGRLVVITYHSLEDRIVKDFMKTGNFSGEIVKDFYGNIERPFRLINNKVIVPTEEEININPRARSAKLRIAEKDNVEI